jgi:hypothetical protein
MKIKALALGLLLASSSAFAADVEGTWTGSIDSPNGAIAISYTFKAQGDALTGSTSGPDGMPIAITDGKIQGNKLSFSLTLDFGAGPTTFVYTGEVSATELMLHTAFMDMPIDMLLKKT